MAVARDTRIVGNWIYENADQGVQLYPDARGTYVAGNVIDGNGEGIIFGGLRGWPPRDNLVAGQRDQQLAHPQQRRVPLRGAGPTAGNVVRRNCIGGGARDDGNGGICSPQIGFRARDNVVAKPPSARLGTTASCRVAPARACSR